MKKSLLLIMVTGFSGFMYANRTLSNASLKNMPVLEDDYVFVNALEDPLDEMYFNIMEALQEADSAKQDSRSTFSKTFDYFFYTNSGYKKVVQAINDYCQYVRSNIALLEGARESLHRVVDHVMTIKDSIHRNNGADCDYLSIKKRLIDDNNVLVNMKKFLDENNKLLDKMFDHFVVYGALLEERNTHNSYTGLLKTVNVALGNLVIKRTVIQYFDREHFLHQTVETELQKIKGLLQAVSQKITDNRCDNN